MKVRLLHFTAGNFPVAFHLTESKSQGPYNGPQSPLMPLLPF